MVKENRLFIGNPGTGKSTLINCLLGEKRFDAGISWAVGLTKGYECFVKDDIAYMDTPGLADEAILEQAAQSITTALKQGGTYKLFFMVRIQSGRVVSEDIVTLDRVLDSLDTSALGELNYKYTVIMNALGAVQYETLMKRGDEFKQIKTLVNRKYLTESFCFVPRIPELEESNIVVDLPQACSDAMDDAPTICIEADYVNDIDIAGLARQTQEIRNELERLRLDQAALLKELKAQEERYVEALRLQRLAHEAELERLHRDFPAHKHWSERGSPSGDYIAIPITEVSGSGCCSQRIKVWHIVITLVLIAAVIVIIVLATNNSSYSY